MPQYLLSVYQPDGDPPPPEVLDPIMGTSGPGTPSSRRPARWVFTGRPAPAQHGHVVRARDGEPLITDGPFAEGKEHLGGFTVIRAPDLDAALDWAAQAHRRDHAAGRGAARPSSEG